MTDRPLSLNLIWHKRTDVPPQDDRARLIHVQQKGCDPVYTFAIYIPEMVGATDCSRWRTMDFADIFCHLPYRRDVTVLGWAEIKIGD